jgi:hypothetical protein
MKTTFAGIAPLSLSAQAARFILCLLGGPGIGKTAAFAAIGDALGIPTDRRKKVNFGAASPAEVSGFAVPPAGGGRLRWEAPDWLPLAAEVGDEPYLLMLDEFADWDGAVQSLFRSVIDPEGVPAIGPHKLPAGLFVVLTGNRSQDGSRTSRVISAPLTSRAVTAELIPSLREVTGYLGGQGLGGTSTWQFLSFLTPEQEQGLFAPPVPAPWTGAPFPTPRGWEAVARMEQATSALSLPENSLRLAVEGTVGESAAGAFWAFRNAIAQWAPLVADVRAGRDTLADKAAMTRSAVAAAAVRVAVRESVNDPAAAVASGRVDWLVDILSQAGPERGEAGYVAVGPESSSPAPSEP